MVKSDSRKVVRLQEKGELRACYPLPLHDGDIKTCRRVNMLKKLLDVLYAAKHGEQVRIIGGVGG